MTSWSLNCMKTLSFQAFRKGEKLKKKFLLASLERGQGIKKREDCNQTVISYFLSSHFGTVYKRPVYRGVEQGEPWVPHCFWQSPIAQHTLLHPFINGFPEATQEVRGWESFRSPRQGSYLGATEEKSVPPNEGSLICPAAQKICFTHLAP